MCSIVLGKLRQSDQRPHEQVIHCMISYWFAPQQLANSSAQSVGKLLTFISVSVCPFPDSFMIVESVFVCVQA